MHIIIALLVVFVLLYFFLQTRQKAESTDGELPSEQPIEQEIVYIANGKLFYRTPENQIDEIHSEYVQGVIDRMERIKKRHSWKENTSFGVMSSGGTRRFTSDQIKIQVISAQFVPEENRLLYFLKDEQFGGLFEYDIETKKEKRLLHKQNLFFHDLNLNPENQKMLCSMHATGGIANIALLDREGSGFYELTGGDTVDSAPAWIPGDEQRILFQSAGIARSPEGYPIAYGPASIQMLDREAGTLTAILDNPKFDYLQPRVCANGNLHFIRRPYEAPRYGSGQWLTDVLFFPFRLLRAVFHYLNFFSLMYTRKPLTSADGPQLQADLKDIIVKGKKIDAENAIRKENRVKGVPSLVPDSWQLVCRNRSGQEKILATNVASFAFSAFGDIVYTNGCGVFLLDKEQRPKLIFKDKLIGEVVAR